MVQAPAKPGSVARCCARFSGVVEAAAHAAPSTASPPQSRSCVDPRWLHWQRFAIFGSASRHVLNRSKFESNVDQRNWNISRSHLLVLLSLSFLPFGATERRLDGFGWGTKCNWQYRLRGATHWWAPRFSSRYSPQRQMHKPPHLVQPIQALCRQSQLKSLRLVHKGRRRRRPGRLVAPARRFAVPRHNLSRKLLLLSLRFSR